MNRARNPNPVGTLLAKSNTSTGGAARSVLVLLAIAVSANAQFEIPWSTVDNGGAMRSTGGAFQLSGTIGQADAGTLAGGSFVLTGGFWFEHPSGDFNADGQVDASDYEVMADCLEGPGESVSPLCPIGVDADLDGDGDCDLMDFALFAQRLTN
jgi:hypothetical protein